MYVVDNLYDAMGHTGNSYYVRFAEADTGEMWDSVAGALATLPAWANMAIDLVEKGTTGQFPVIVPANLPKGHRYDFVIHKKVGSQPANTDDVMKQDTFTLGEFFGF